MVNKSVLHNRHVLIACVLFTLIVFLSQCISGTNTPVAIKDDKGELFAGSASCISCHKNVYDSFMHTAHHRSSRIADVNSIKGSFEQGKNMFVFGNSIVAMEKKNDGFYQVEYDTHFENNGSGYQETNSGRFDIVIGSNTKGQSYLSWDSSRLFQLPISYFTVANSWCNSPGYPFRAVYNRNITPRCLECHSTYAKVVSAPEVNPEQFDSRQIMYGIDCEKCHGAGAKHVAFQSQNPDSKIAKYIVNPEKLSRQQSLEFCSLCHSGSSLHQTKPSFSFSAGDSLTNYFKRDSTPADIHSVDVHGNQYGLLRASQCFKKSETMTCNTCHNTHNEERGNTVLFSERCMSCHNEKDAVICPLTARLGATVIGENCIDCHMPLFASKVISVLLPGDTTVAAATVRSHYISIYPQETDKILALIRNKNQSHH